MTASNQISEETVARTLKRVRKLSDAELVSWADVALPGMMRHLDYFRRTDEAAHLMELAYAEMQLGIVVTELVERYAARREEGLTSE